MVCVNDGLMIPRFTLIPYELAGPEWLRQSQSRAFPVLWLLTCIEKL